MANTIIQLRRSNTASDPGTTLFAGELAYAYTTAQQSLFIGSNSGVGTAGIRIAGQKYVWLHQANTSTPGAQAANATVLTDGNSFVYNVFTQGLLIGPTATPAPGNNTVAHITSISNTANTTQLGASPTGSGTELVTSAAIYTFVSGLTGANPGGANTQVQFNDSATFGGDADFTFDKATNILAVGNNTLSQVRVGTAGTNSFINSIAIVIQSNTTVNTTTTDTSYTVANNLSTSLLNPASVRLGAGTANAFVNSTAFVVQSNSTVNATITPVTLFVGNSTINLTFGSSTLDVRATNTNITSNVTITSANIDATSAFLRIQQGLVTGNLTVQGNLSVTGTLTSIDTTNIVVQDPVLVINDGGVTTDTADVGFVGYFGNSTVTQVGGLVRKSGAAAAGYANTFMLFTSQTAFTNTTSTVPIDANLQLATLQSWLYASANSTTTGKLVANTTGVTITANSTWAVNITANSLSLTTQLPVGSGGTGVGTVPLGGLLLGNTTSAMVALSPGTNGQILQVLNSGAAGAASVVGFGGIDGGTF